MSARVPFVPGFAVMPHGGRARLRDLAVVWTRIAQIMATRRQLAEMDDRMLSDLGISRSDALAEADRLPWDFSDDRACRSGRGVGRASSGWLTRAAAGLREAARRYRTRRQIAELDARALRDIGLTWAEAEREANKPFWSP